MNKTEEQKKFDKLVEKIYDIWKENESGLVCILYDALSKVSFRDIRDIKGYLNSGDVDCIYIKSLLTGTEVQIYACNMNKMTIRTYQNMISIKKGNLEPIHIKFKK